MPDPHERSIDSALLTVVQLGKLADRLRAGNSPIYRAYRVVIRSLRRNLDDPRAITDALETLEDSVRVASQGFYERASGIGLAQAKRDLAIYGLGEPDPVDDDGIFEAIVSILGLVAAQGERVKSVASLDMGDELILGDDSRQGILAPAAILTEIAFWITGLSVLSYLESTSKKMRGFVRQAVAQVDDDTTQTCLNVHGQIVGLKEDFHLTGTPRFADNMHRPAFHRNCRTAVATIRKDLIDPEVTADMRDDAIEQGKKPKPSTLKGRAHFRVVGKSVQEFRGGRWHTFKRFDTQLAARKEAARLNEARRS
ncbi:MAG: hypothetical protein KAJ73_01015 [Zetaproteobacteria bacterium]|nr:hypothetical protein [Zetaproteobacteria bacterium]